MLEPPSRGAPVARQQVTVAIHHGVEVVDEFAWLRDPRWREVLRGEAALDPEIEAYLLRENAYAVEALAAIDPLIAALDAEIRGRIPADDSSVPDPDGEWAYFTRYVSGAQLRQLCRVHVSGSPEQVILDGNELAAGRTSWRLMSHHHSPDHRYLAYVVDETGAETGTLRIRDLLTGRDLTGEVPRVGASFVWTNDSAGIVHVAIDESFRASSVWFHRPGEPASSAVRLFVESDPGFTVRVEKTRSRCYLVITCVAHETSEAWVMDAAGGVAPLRCIAERRAGREYSVEHHDDDFIVTTNDGGAVDFKICTAPVADPAPERWRDLVEHAAGCLRRHVTVFRDHLVYTELEDGRRRIVIRRWRDGETHVVAYPEPACAITLMPGFDPSSKHLRFEYSSLTTPDQIFDYDMEQRTRELRKARHVPMGHDPERYVTRVLSAPARDGATVPITLLHHHDTVLDGSAPLYRYAYGAYGIPISPYFDAPLLSIIDRGFVYAIAHVRGGKEKGHAWHASGVRDHRENAFGDVLDVARHLIDVGVTRPGRIVAEGASAGAMLFGALANRDPELFLAMILDVPFLDVLLTTLDGSLPLTPLEWSEWGNPVESRADFQRIAAYCPYQNIGRHCYPAMLVRGNLGDSRVGYWEPAKWVARLRARKLDDNPLLLLTNMAAGHGGVARRYDWIREKAVNYAFALAMASDAVARP